EGGGGRRRDIGNIAYACTEIGNIRDSASNRHCSASATSGVGTVSWNRRACCRAIGVCPLDRWARSQAIVVLRRCCSVKRHYADTFHHLSASQRRIRVHVEL